MSILASIRRGQLLMFCTLVRSRYDGSTATTWKVAWDGDASTMVPVYTYTGSSFDVESDIVKNPYFVDTPVRSTTVGVTVVTVVGEVLVPAGGVLVVGFATVVGGEPEVTGAEPTEVDGTVVVTSCPFPGDGTWSPGGADPDAPEPEPAATQPTEMLARPSCGVISPTPAAGDTVG
jgi:hypothetical protein